ncbi:MAG: ABC transporter permease [Bacteroidota bacterium]
MVLTQSTAKSLFGNEDPVNKTVRFDNQHDLKVTGILKDIPANSFLEFNFLVPLQIHG